LEGGVLFLAVAEPALDLVDFAAVLVAELFGEAFALVVVALLVVFGLAFALDAVEDLEEVPLADFGEAFAAFVLGDSAFLAGVLEVAFVFATAGDDLDLTGILFAVFGEAFFAAARDLDFGFSAALVFSLASSEALVLAEREAGFRIASCFGAAFLGEADFLGDAFTGEEAFLAVVLAGDAFCGEADFFASTLGKQSFCLNMHCDPPTILILFLLLRFFLFILILLVLRFSFFFFLCGSFLHWSALFRFILTSLFVLIVSPFGFVFLCEFIGFPCCPLSWIFGLDLYKFVVFC